MAEDSLGILTGEVETLSRQSSLVWEIEAARTAGEAWASSWDQERLFSELVAAKVILARSSTQEIGFVLLRAPGALWEITLIFVVPGMRGKGVFERLIQAAKRVASCQDVANPKEVSSSRLGLEVRADNGRALNAYQKVGFMEVSRRKGYYRDGCDAILLEILL